MWAHLTWSKRKLTSDFVYVFPPLPVFSLSLLSLDIPAANPHYFRKAGARLLFHVREYVWQRALALSL
jgi:hypothetical protein